MWVPSLKMKSVCCHGSRSTRSRNGTAKEILKFCDAHRRSSALLVASPLGLRPRKGCSLCELRKARSIWVMSPHRSAPIALCTPCANKCPVRRHEPCQHRWHKLGGLDSLAMLLCKNLGVGHEIAIYGGRQFDGELDQPIIRNGGKFQLSHWSEAQLW